MRFLKSVLLCFLFLIQIFICHEGAASTNPVNCIKNQINAAQSVASTARASVLNRFYRGLSKSVTTVSLKGSKRKAYRDVLKAVKNANSGKKIPRGLKEQIKKMVYGASGTEKGKGVPLEVLSVLSHGGKEEGKRVASFFNKLPRSSKTKNGLETIDSNKFLDAAITKISKEQGLDLSSLKIIHSGGREISVEGVRNLSKNSAELLGELDSMAVGRLDGEQLFSGLLKQGDHGKEIFYVKDLHGNLLTIDDLGKIRRSVDDVSFIKVLNNSGEESLLPIREAGTLRIHNRKVTFDVSEKSNIDKAFLKKIKKKDRGPQLGGKLSKSKEVQKCLGVFQKGIAASSFLRDKLVGSAYNLALMFFMVAPITKSAGGCLGKRDPVTNECLTVYNSDEMRRIRAVDALTSLLITAPIGTMISKNLLVHLKVKGQGLSPSFLTAIVLKYGSKVKVIADIEEAVRKTKTVKDLLKIEQDRANASAKNIKEYNLKFGIFSQISGMSVDKSLLSSMPKRNYDLCMKHKGLSSIPLFGTPSQMLRFTEGLAMTGMYFGGRTMMVGE